MSHGICIHIGNDLDEGHYICDVLDYSTGTWWKCDDEIITKYPKYPNNVYDEFEGDPKNQTKKKRQNMDGSECIVSMLFTGT